MIDIIPDRYRLAAGAVAITVVLAGSALVGAVVNGWRLDVSHQLALAAKDKAHGKEITKRDTALTAAKEAARKREAELITQRDKAIDDANLRDQTIRSLAAGSARASGGLRDTLASISRGVPSAPVAALRHSTATLAAVLEDCQGKYRDLAEKADRHASDTITLKQAWPTNPPAQAK